MTRYRQNKSSPIQDSPEVQDLFISGLPLVAGIAAKVRIVTRTPLEDDELQSFGRVGLLRAARTFDPKKGNFKFFAEQRIKGAIIDGIRTMCRHGRNAYERLQQSDEFRAHCAQMKSAQVSGLVADRNGDDFVAGRSVVDPEDGAEMLRRKRKLQEALADLSTLEDVIVRRHANDETLNEIGEGLGISRDKAFRTLKAAMKKLAHRVRPPHWSQ